MVFIRRQNNQLQNQIRPDSIDTTGLSRYELAVEVQINRVGPYGLTDSRGEIE